MRFLSTRGGDSGADFDTVLRQALASDGGLYLPESWPEPRDWSRLRSAPFEAVAAEILRLFAEPCLTETEAMTLCERAFAGFRHPERTPLTRFGEDRLLELFHGPTLAFKDVAMQLIGVLFERDLARRGAEMTVVVATSGDTGGAAVAALAGRPGIRLCVLHPHGRISEVQRRFMTTSGGGNITNLAVEGTFDDCQAMVKELFADRPFAQRVGLSGVNSINWARITAQVSYYVTACLAVAEGPVHFAVPTGNFGDVFAGDVARRIGAPVGRLIVAVNYNDILDRALRTGIYEKRGVRPTSSPSMDIEVASNFERALFEALGRDANAAASLMADLKERGRFTIPPSALLELQKLFASERAGEAAADSEMTRMEREHGILVDPHTAIGLHAAGRMRRGGLEGPIVTLATAHAAKFPDAVEKATGQRPDIPDDIGRDLWGTEAYDVVPADANELKTRLLA